MKNKSINAAQVWKQMEDLLAPQLNFSLADRVIYSHLFRHSRLEGKLQLQFSISWLARSVGLSMKFTRDTVRRLIARGVLHLVECNCRAQHVVRLRLPLEVKGICAEKIAAHRPAPPPPVVINIEEADFLEKQILRKATNARAAAASIVRGGSPTIGGAWTMLCRERSWDRIPIETWCPAVWNATRKKGSARPRSFCAGYTASGA